MEGIKQNAFPFSSSPLAGTAPFSCPTLLPPVAVVRGLFNLEGEVPGNLDCNEVEAVDLGVVFDVVGAVVGREGVVAGGFNLDPTARGVDLPGL